MPIFVPQPVPSTSGITDYPITRDIILRRALRIVGAYTSTDKPRPEQLVDAEVAFNSMMKLWTIEGLLWLRQFITIPLVAGQNNYVLGPATPAPLGPINRPSHVFNANRKYSSGNEVPMEKMTRTDWMAIPNKTTQSPPVQFYYDRQTTNGILYIWPVPQTGTTDTIVADVDRQLEIMVDNINILDMPPEWVEPCVYQLAARIAPEYGIPIAERTKLENTANDLFNKAVDYDQDMASVRLGVRRR